MGDGVCVKGWAHVYQ